MLKSAPLTITLIFLLCSGLVQAQSGPDGSGGSGIDTDEQNDSFSLIVDTPEEGFQLAITLSRKGVTETQSDREVLFSLREQYANDPDALIASSQVIAIHFQTIAAANNYWR